MSSSTSQRAAKSRERLAVMEAAAKKRQHRNTGFAAGGTVVVVVVALILARLVVGGHSTTAAPVTSGDTVTQQLAAVPASATDAVGNGSGVTAPVAFSATSGAKVAALTSGGKPEIVYVGAEFCPYCAAERWAVVEALSRFGTFSNLGQTTSSATDVYPSTPTLTFHGSSYTSQYLVFKGYEIEDGKQQPLDTMPADVSTLFSTLDAPPYVSSEAKESFPWVDLGGVSFVNGAQYDPQLLHGLTQAQVTTDLSNPKSPVAQAILGAANQITKRLCALTGNQPAAVCSAAGVTAAA